MTKPGQVFKAPASGVDFLPTLCSMAKAKIPKNLVIDGTDLTPLFKGEPIKRKTPLQWHYYNATLKEKDSPRAVMRRGDYILTGYYQSQKNIGTGRWYPNHMDFLKGQKLTSFELFELPKDKQQRTNVVKQYPEVFKKMKTELIKYHKQLQQEAYGWQEESK